MIFDGVRGGLPASAAITPATMLPQAGRGEEGSVLRSHEGFWRQRERRAFTRSQRRVSYGHHCLPRWESSTSSEEDARGPACERPRTTSAAGSTWLWAYRCWRPTTCASSGG